MDIFISVFLPLALVVIMFSLGLGLEPADFRRVAERPRAFFAGAAAQFLLLPATAYAVAVAFALPPELAVGLMILSFCPGGMTSNMLTKMARGDLALSISLTGVITLVSIFTVPVLTGLAARHFLGLDAPQVDVTRLGMALFAVTALPVAAGIAIRHYRPALARRLDPPVGRISVVLFLAVVVGALAANWSLFTENLPRLGPSLVVLNLVLLALGFGLAVALALSPDEATAISIEVGVQNATLGITVGSLIVEQAGELPPFSLPSGVYGITMYVVVLPVILWRRRLHGAAR